MCLDVKTTLAENCSTSRVAADACSKQLGKASCIYPELR